MKQRITVDDLQQLTDEQKQKLREWWKPEDGDWFYGSYGADENGFVAEQDEWQEYILTPYCVDSGHYGPSLHECGAKPDVNAIPLLSIGQMIELLQDRKLEIHAPTKINSWWRVWYSSHINPAPLTKRKADNLCDALFEAVKEIL